uniref:DUF4738 domain-containing protein n=1 Tax=Prevotella sp. GTC17262 TaxID=3236797 RepID=A0AB33JPQ2_9BACT
MHRQMNYTDILVDCVLLTLLLLMPSCNNKERKAVVQENRAAKKMLQGVWIDEEEDGPAFRVKGDTIYYPDSTSMPVYFQVVRDTLVLRGTNTVKYPIVKQAPHLFIFKNQIGDVITLQKTTDHAYLSFFQTGKVAALNQQQLIKRDSVVMYADERYHYYVQVNPTSYKVVKSSYNDDGVEVENVYYDNIVHLGVFNGNRRLYSRDFRKQDFRSKVPEQTLRQSVLSDIVYVKSDSEGLHFSASICIPDSPSSYVVEVIVDAQGRMKMQVV